MWRKLAQNTSVKDCLNCKFELWTVFSYYVEKKAEKAAAQICICVQLFLAVFLPIQNVPKEKQLSFLMFYTLFYLLLMMCELLFPFSVS